MPAAGNRDDKIRQFILQNVEAYPEDIAQITCTEFSLDKQAISQHLNHLVEDESLIAHGNSKNRVYELRTLLEWEKRYELSLDLSEDVIWD